MKTENFFKILITSLLISILFKNSLITVKAFKLNSNNTSSKNIQLKKIKEHKLTNKTDNSNILNEEILDDTIEELTDLSNDIEMKLKELKKRELIMDADKKNIGVFASITMIALVLLFYLGIAHMEDALKDANILHGEGGSPQNVIFDPRW